MNVQSTNSMTTTETDTESFASLFAESISKQEMRTGEVITAEVVRIDQNHVIVNAGLKSEAVIPTAQFLNERGKLEVEVGDEVEVALDAVEDGFGETRLSREKAKRMRTWIVLQEAFDESPVWPRYLVSSEEREVFVLIASGATASTSTEVNGNYKILGQDANGFNVYTKGGTSADFIYKNVSGQWVVDVFASATKQSDGSYSVSGGSVQFTEADSPTTSSPFDVKGKSRILLPKLQKKDQ